MHGAVKRIQPKIMTVSVILAVLVPIIFSDGAPEYDIKIFDRFQNDSKQRR